jgi:serine/threonine protein kinase
MSDLVGQTILHYKIIQQVGHGGMGVVYKAQDTKLDRIVALKFLPQYALSNNEDKERFIREAKAAASLNHQNIAHIYEIDEEVLPDGKKQIFIAMEYIEGKTLEEIIHSNGGSPLPLKTAINYSIQIADGLQTAHEKGIVHRDIKSANIMVNDKDQIKIMDFGLAKLAGSTKVTTLGTTMGTAAYMSPEQASGEKVDHRTDIWSLGVVMYEMICGQLPFKNDYNQALLYSIMNEEPEPLTAKRTGIPLSFDGVISKALAKDPSMRYQHVDEIPADLRTIELKSGSVITRIPSQTRSHPALQKSESKLKIQLPWLVTGFVIIVSFFLFFFIVRGNDIDYGSYVSHLSIVIPSDHKTLRIDDQEITISPDGKYVAYVGLNNGNSQIFVRSMDNFKFSALEGTMGAVGPFFSPDNKWIAFFAEGKLKKIPIQGGTPETLCNAPGSRGGDWSDDNKIIFSPDYSAGLLEISPDGGKIDTVSRLDYSKFERTHRWPQVLPGSEWLLFTIGDQTNVNSYNNSTIALQSLKTGKCYILTVRGNMVRYIKPGFLIIARNGNLYCSKFDPDNPENLGPPSVVVQNVEGNAGSGISYFSISKNGQLVYIPGSAENSEVGLAMVDMNGIVNPLKIEKRQYASPRFSHNGNKIAVTLGQSVENDGDIWILNLKTNTFTRFTFGPGNYNPVWNNDGKNIYYASGTSGSEGIMFKASDGSNAGRNIFHETILDYPVSMSPDSRYLIFNKFNGPTQGDIFKLDLVNGYKLDTLLATKDFEYDGFVSSDGKWFLYGSNETGRQEIYLKTYPELEGKWQISNEGGSNPVWSPKGDEIYYISLQFKMMSVSIQSKPTLTIGNPKVLFDATNMVLPNSPQNNYDISPDGEKFIIVLKNNQNKSQQNINVILNWEKELKEKLNN